MLLGMLLSSCASVSTVGLARTLNKGAVQGWAGPSLIGVVDTRPGVTTPVPTFPLLEAGVRVGVTDWVELGGKLGLSGVGVEGKVALLRPDSMDSGINLSINPRVTYFGVGEGLIYLGMLTFQLPVLIGIDFKGHELVLGPKLVDQLIFGSGSGNIVYAGASVGFAVRIASGFRMLPEIALSVPLIATGTAPGGTSTIAPGGLLFQATLGFLFGTPDQYERAEPLPPPTAPPLVSPGPLEPVQPPPAL